MEEALWDIEDKWKLSTQEAFLLLGCAALAVVGLGVATFLKRSRRKKDTASAEKPSQARRVNETTEKFHSAPSCGGGVVEAIAKRALMGSLRWSRARKWGERQPPLLAVEGGGGGGWHSHNSESPVWQRPILMGEKCELPRFSGLILYDDRGRPLRDTHDRRLVIIGLPREKLPETTAAAAGRTTLKDLL